jgi:gamma-glutamylcyclotransferase
MSSPRLAGRVPSARALGVATLDGYRLAFHKRSVDGSGKCDALFTGDSEDLMYGVVYRMDQRHRVELDRVEGLGWGYVHAEVEVSPLNADSVRALTYTAVAIDSRLRPYDWYRHHVIAGALEHGLPAPYVATIRAVECVEDPDPGRAEREMGIYRGGGAAPTADGRGHAG